MRKKSEATTKNNQTSAKYRRIKFDLSYPISGAENNEYEKMKKRTARLLELFDYYDYREAKRKARREWIFRTFGL